MATAVTLPRIPAFPYTPSLWQPELFRRVRGERLDHATGGRAQSLRSGSGCRGERFALTVSKSLKEVKETVR
jgi:hypothetical protein